jgi:ATP-binding cassette subfamily C protein
MSWSFRRNRSRGAPTFPSLAFAGVLLRNFPGRFLLALLLLIVQGLTEGIGLLLLVPLLALVGLPVGTGAPAAVEDAVRSVFAAVRLPLNLEWVLLGFLLVIGVRSLLRWWTTVTTYTLEQNLALRYQQGLYEAIFCAGWITLVRERIPELTHALTVDVERVAEAAGHLLRLLTLGIVTAAFVAVAVFLAPGMTLLAALLGLLLLSLGGGWNRRVRESGEELTRAGQEVNASVQDFLGTLKTAKSYGAEERSVEEFRRRSERFVLVMLTATWTYASAQGWLTFFSAFLLCGLVYVSIQLLGVPLATLLILVFIFSRVVPRALSFQSTYHYFLNALPGYENVVRLTNRCDDAAEIRLGGEGGVRRDIPRMERGVRLEGVTFRYDPEAEEAVVRDISLSIPANRTTALIGRSGAGKTTVADLVLGLIRPQEGQVLVDDRPLELFLLPGWRRQIGYVSQDGALLPDTVRANLLWASPHAQEDDLWEALHLAAADDFVRRLPRGLDTVVGERGSLLSGGERQRLSLAVALVRKPSLLVLDEATSSLDAENERRILEALRGIQGETTVLIISHRPSAVRDAETIHVLEDGKIMASGNWAALNALFRRGVS